MRRGHSRRLEDEAEGAAQGDNGLLAVRERQDIAEHREQVVCALLATVPLSRRRVQRRCNVEQ